MTAVIGVYGNLQNVWTFSNCSIGSMKINLLVKNTTVSNNGQCLVNIPTQTSQILNINFLSYQPGQLWNLDRQCQIAMGWPDSSAESCGVFF